MRSTKIIKICSSSLCTCLHHMVILRTRNKITDFLMILAWASPFNAYNSSSDPRLVGGYYINTVEQQGGCPRIIRGDCGTENVHVKDFHTFLRNIDGPSTSNQRIEYWWSFLRRQCSEFWINFFKELEGNGHFSGSYVDVNLIQYCFMHIVQASK